MTELVLATHNPGKVRELRALLSALPFQVVDLESYPDSPKSEENYETYLENARDKARLTAQFTGKLCLAEDSGLEVEALGGNPGVHSARYAGEPSDAGANIEKLLRELRGIPQERRRARFVCTMLLYDPKTQKEWLSEGELLGYILGEKRGVGGFGYDPVFSLEPKGPSLAELGAEIKNRISHRALALQKMTRILTQNLRHF